MGGGTQGTVASQRAEERSRIKSGVAGEEGKDMASDRAGNRVAASVHMRLRGNHQASGHGRLEPRQGGRQTQAGSPPGGRWGHCAASTASIGRGGGVVATEGAMLSPTSEQPPLLACVFGELGHLHLRRPCRY